jgi:hypothetical protein
MHGAPSRCNVGVNVKNAGGGYPFSIAAATGHCLQLAVCGLSISKSVLGHGRATHPSPRVVPDRGRHAVVPEACHVGEEAMSALRPRKQGLAAG